MPSPANQQEDQQARERETPPETRPVLTARIAKTLLSAEREFSLDLEFAATPGFTILFGASGAGKTTLLDCVAGLVTPDAGRIAIGEKIFFDVAGRIDVPVSRRGVGYVFQDLALFPHLTAQQNVQYGLAYLPRTQREERALAILHAFHIEQLRRQRPAQISGGERQRVALARALVTDPVVLLLDEPLAALDTPTKSKILDDLRRWNHEHQIPILYVTHSREEVFALGERVLVLDQGRIIAQGAPHEVLGAPRRETVAQLAGFENIFDATVESVHEDRGTMLCRIMPCRITTCGITTAAVATSSPPGSEAVGTVSLETPLVRAEIGSPLRIGIRAGDILLAVAPPIGLSARNLILGQIVSLERRDVIISAKVDCGVEMEVHLTLASRDALQLAPGRDVWLVIKTHSCSLMPR
jgi:molybdate transport system ATP-binding protein